MIVSFATDDAHYSPYARCLRDQCDRHGMASDIRLIEPWSDDAQEHCCYKPTFIRDRLQEHGAVLWLDVDSEIHATIEIDTDADVGFCDNPLRRTRQNIVNRVTGGAVYFGDTENARHFLHLWIESCADRKPGEVADHRRMDLLRQAIGSEMNVADITAQLAGRVTFYGVRGSLAIPV